MTKLDFETDRLDSSIPRLEAEDPRKWVREVRRAGSTTRSAIGSLAALALGSERLERRRQSGFRSLGGTCLAYHI